MYSAGLFEELDLVEAAEGVAEVAMLLVGLYRDAAGRGDGIIAAIT